MTDQYQSAQEFFGAPSAQGFQAPDEFFGIQKTPAQQEAEGVIKSQKENLGAVETTVNAAASVSPSPLGAVVRGIRTLMGSQTAAGPLMDDFFTHTAVGRVMDAFGQGAKEGWGTGTTQMDPDLERALQKLGIFNDYSKGQNDLTKNFNEALIRPAVRALQLGLNTFGAGFEGVAGAAAQTATEAGQPLLGRDIASMIEQYPLLHMAAHVAPPPFIEQARNLGVIGGDEARYFGTEAPTPEGITAVAPEIKDAVKAAQEAEKEGVPPPSLPKPAPDINTAARQIEPDLFRKYDALSARKDTFQNWIGELRDKHIENVQDQFAPRIQDVQDKIQTILDKVKGNEDDLTKAAAGRLDALRTQHDAIMDEMQKAAQTDSPDVQRIKAEYQKTWQAMNDLSPQVRDAYRKASGQVEPTAPETPAPEQAAQVPAEAGAEGAPAAEAQPEAFPAEPGAASAETHPPVQSQPEPVEAKPEPKPIETASAGPYSTPEMVQRMVDERTKQLTAVGRPAEVARAEATVEAAYYATRAERFNGALGTAEDLWRNESPGLKVARQKVEEFAQKGDLAQSNRGKIRLYDEGRSMITIFKQNDASTVIHEFGHQYLRDLLRDATNEKAPEDLKNDAQTMRDWLGVDGDDVTTRQHEKAARGFERYMMEGRAPTPGLAGVFSQFKDWLTKIYDTVKSLRVPLTDEVRGVFDRMLNKYPEEKPVITGENPDEVSMAERHEDVANSTPPERARDTADEMRRESDTHLIQNAPEVKDELDRQGIGDGIRGRDQAEQLPLGGGDEAGPRSPEDGGFEASGPVGPGGGETEAKSPEGQSSEPGLPGRNGDLVDKAGNIRLDNMNTTSDVEDVIREMARRNFDFTDQRGSLASRQLHAEIFATRNLLRQVATENMELSRKVASGSQADAAAFAASLAKMDMVGRKLSEMTYSWGYAGRAFRKLPGDYVAQQIRKMAGPENFEDFNQLQKIASRMSQFDDYEQAARFASDVQATKWQKTRSWIEAIFINNLISGPITHAGYSMGNEMFALWRLGPETALQSVVGAFGKGEDRVQAGEVQAQLYAHFGAFKDGLSAAYRSLKAGQQELPPSLAEFVARKGAEGEAVRGTSIKPSLPTLEGETAIAKATQLAAKAVEAPSHMVTAIHTMFFNVNYSSEIARLAYRDAVSKGLEGDDFNTSVARFRMSPPDEAIQSASDEAWKAVLMERPAYGGLTQKVQGLGKDYLAFKMIMPFAQIGSNILKQGLFERTPIGAMFDETTRADLRGTNGEVAQQLRYGKIIGGSMLGVAAVGATLTGIMTGGGPSDPKERARLRDSGWLPYSLKIGDQYIPFRKYLGPLGPIMAGAADMAEIGKAAPDTDLGELGAAVTMGLSEVVMDETWMRGVADFIDAIREWDTKGDKYLRNLATDFIPYSVGMSQMARTLDPYSRRINGWVDAFKAKIPGLSQQLEPMRDVFGEPLSSRTLLSPSTDKMDPVRQEFADQDWFPAQLEKKIVGVDLSPEQYDDYQRVAGRLTRMRLDALVNMPGWSSIPEGMRNKQFKEAVEKSRRDARVVIKAENPDIIQKAKITKLEQLMDN